MSSEGSLGSFKSTALGLVVAYVWYLVRSAGRPTDDIVRYDMLKFVRTRQRKDLSKICFVRVLARIEEPANVRVGTHGYDSLLLASSLRCSMTSSLAALQYN